jgi:UDP-glucuronate decarboxylase
MRSRLTQTDVHEAALRLGTTASAFAGRTVLLTGAGGFLGTYFVELFRDLNRTVLKSSCHVIAYDNFITRGPSRLPPNEGGVEFKNHDVIKPLEIDGPVDYIIHAAGIASPEYYRRFPLETLEVATIGTKNMLELARNRQSEAVLFFSSSEIYGDPDPSHVPTTEDYRGNVTCLGPRACYDESKRLGETLCGIYHGSYGVPAKIVRPFNVYGPGMQQNDYRVLPNFASRILDGAPLLVYSNGRQTRTYCYVGDAIVGFLQVLVAGRAGEAYNIGNPAPEISVVQLVEILSEVVGRRLEFRLVEYPDSYPPDEPQRRCPAIDKARRDLGYEPRISIHDGLGRFMAWAADNYRLSVPDESRTD